jgi:hypothetical protein
MYSIVAKMGAKSLDVFDHLTTDGTKIQQWHYLGESQQQWLITQL